MTLLIGAGLLIRSFTHLQNVSPGFNPANVLTLELTMTGRKYNDADAILQTYQQLWERLAALPGVTAAGGVSALPLSQMMAWGPITVEGRVAPEGEKFINADIRIVGGDYFKAMDIPLIQGRLFSQELDTRTSPRVVIIDERMARQFWPGENPIGRRIRTGGFDVTPDTPWMTIVGVVNSVKQDALDADSRIAYYRFQGQTPSRAMNVVVRSATDPAGLTGAVTREIRALDPDLPIYKMRTMEERVEASLAERRFSMLLLTLFAVLALGPRGDRDLRRDVLSRRPGHAGTRHPPGARRCAAGSPAARRPPGHVDRRRRNGARAGGRIRADALHADAALRRAGQRSGDVRSYCGDVVARSAGRVLHPGPPGGENGCDCVVEDRIVTSEGLEGLGHTSTLSLPRASHRRARRVRRAIGLGVLRALCGERL